MADDSPSSGSSFGLANKMERRRATSGGASVGRDMKKPQLPKLPTTAELKALVDEARLFAGQVIEQPFCEGVAEYYLTCVSGRNKEAPLMWTFYVGNGSSAQAALVYETADVSLLQNMIECAMPTQSTPAAAIAATAAESEAPPAKAPSLEKGAIDGLLAKMPIGNLMQSLAGADATGKLVVTRPQHEAVAFFEAGKLIHCECDQTVGEDGVIDLLFWKEGEFHFYPDEKANMQTVKRRLEGMLMESANLQDFSAFLVQREIGLETLLTRVVNNDQQYKELLKNAVPTNDEIQLNFTKAVSGTRKLGELIRDFNFTPSSWIPIVYNLAKAGIVVPITAPEKAEQLKKLQPVQIDGDVIKIARKNLIKRETGVYSYPAFLLFLEQEQKRFLAYRRPFTVLLLRIRMRTQQGDLEIPSDEVLKEALKVVEKAKRETDILSHYDTYDFALLLPETDQVAGKTIAARTKELIASFRPGEVDPEAQSQQIDLTIGGATAPTDAEDMGALLAVALAERANPHVQN